MDIDLTPEAKAAAADAETMLSTARAFAVTTAAQYTAAGEELKRIKAKAKELEAQRVGMTRPLDETKKRIIDWFRDPSDLSVGLAALTLLNWRARHAERI